MTKKEKKATELKKLQAMFLEQRKKPTKEELIKETKIAAKLITQKLREFEASEGINLGIKNVTRYSEKNMVTGTKDFLGVSITTNIPTGNGIELGIDVIPALVDVIDMEINYNGADPKAPLLSVVYGLHFTPVATQELYASKSGLLESATDTELNIDAFIKTVKREVANREILDKSIELNLAPTAAKKYDSHTDRMKAAAEEICDGFKELAAKHELTVKTETTKKKVDPTKYGKKTQDAAETYTHVVSAEFKLGRDITQVSVELTQTNNTPRIHVPYGIATLHVEGLAEEKTYRLTKDPVGDFVESRIVGYVSGVVNDKYAL